MKINLIFFLARFGKGGAGKNKTGLNGRKLVISVPVGTVILSEDKKHLSSNVSVDPSLDTKTVLTRLSL